MEISGSVLNGGDLWVNLFNSVFFWPLETCEFLFPGRGDPDDPFLPFVEGVPMTLAAWASCPKMPLYSSEHVRLGFESSFHLCEGFALISFSALGAIGVRPLECLCRGLLTLLEGGVGSKRSDSKFGA